jgi:predicted S18 family serine protease
MTTYKHLLWLAPAVLVIEVIVIVSVDTPIMSSLPTTEISQPDPKSNQNIKQIEVRNEKQSGLKNQAIKHVEVRKGDQEIKQIEIRKEEEQRLKKQDKFYTQQAKAQAERYENMADIVARNGGDPKPLLDAAAYFENESK